MELTPFQPSFASATCWRCWKPIGESPERPDVDLHAAAIDQWDAKALNLKTMSKCPCETNVEPFPTNLLVFNSSPPSLPVEPYPCGTHRCFEVQSALRCIDHSNKSVESLKRF